MAVLFRLLFFLGCIVVCISSEEFSSPELPFSAVSYSVSVPSRVTAVTRKRPRSFCQKRRWLVTPKHVYTLNLTKSEWADYAVQALVWEPIRDSSSYATRQGTLGHSRLSSLNQGGLILA